MPIERYYVVTHTINPITVAELQVPYHKMLAEAFRDSFETPTAPWLQAGLFPGSYLT